MPRGDRLQPDGLRKPATSATPCATRGSWWRPSPNAARRSGSSPTTPHPTPISAKPLRREGKLAGPSPNTREAIRVEPGDANAHVVTSASLPGRPGEGGRGHRRTPRGDPAPARHGRGARQPRQRPARPGEAGRAVAGPRGDPAQARRRHWSTPTSASPWMRAVAPQRRSRAWRQLGLPRSEAAERLVLARPGTSSACVAERGQAVPAGTRPLSRRFAASPGGQAGPVGGQSVRAALGHRPWQRTVPKDDQEAMRDLRPHGHGWSPSTAPRPGCGPRRLTANPRLGEDHQALAPLRRRLRAAALAELPGRGEDKPSLGGGRAGPAPRKQALGWLRAEAGRPGAASDGRASARRKRVGRTRPSATGRKADASLAGVGDPGPALSQTPRPTSRRDWKALWADVDRLREAGGRSAAMNDPRQCPRAHRSREGGSDRPRRHHRPERDQPLGQPGHKPRRTAPRVAPRHRRRRRGPLRAPLPPRPPPRCPGARRRAPAAPAPRRDRPRRHGRASSRAATLNSPATWPSRSCWRGTATTPT